MKIEQLILPNIRSFEKADVGFSSRINALIGKNNSGKSTLLNCVSLIQQPRLVGVDYQRIGSAQGVIDLHFDQVNNIPEMDGANHLRTRPPGAHLEVLVDGKPIKNINAVVNHEEFNVVIPYLSRRKVGSYGEGVALNDTTQVTGNLSNLYAKIGRISNPADTIPNNSGGSWGMVAANKYLRRNRSIASD